MFAVGVGERCARMHEGASSEAVWADVSSLLYPPHSPSGPKKAAANVMLSALGVQSRVSIG